MQKESSTAPNEAFERFRKFAGQVVNTPKAKVDALAKKEKARKQATAKTA